MGVVQSTVYGIGGLIIGVILILVVVSTITNANLLGTATAEANLTDGLVANFSTGIQEVGNKLPTILLIVAVVFLFGALVLLMRNAKLMGIGGSGSL